MSVTSELQETAEKTKFPLWGDVEIEVIVGTGHFSSGKSLFGLTICPGSQTLVYDNEGSNTTYRSFGFDHVDMAKTLISLYPTGYTSEHRYKWWKQDAITKGKTGQYRVLMVDPFSEIEQGLARYVENNPQVFGYTANQFKLSSGLFWGCVKDALKADLDLLRTYYETIYLTVHMRQEFKGGKPTKKMEPKGKTTLMELASLFLEFSRKPDPAGVIRPEPSATVLKSRLSHISIKPDGGFDILPILPPRIPTATPAEIRRYIATPANYNRLKKDEKLVTEVMSDEERLVLESQIAEDNRAAQEAELAKAERMAQAAESQRKLIEASAPVNSSRDGDIAQSAEEKAQAAEDERRAMLAKVRQLAEKCYGDFWKDNLKRICSENGLPPAPSMGLDQLRMLAVNLTNLSQEIAEAEAAEAAEAAAEAPAAATTIPGMATYQQLVVIESLSADLNWPDDKRATFLESRGVGGFNELTVEQADELIAKLNQRLKGFSKGN